MNEINKPFFYFLQLKGFQSKPNDILKIGKEHTNPFYTIQKNRISIGLFGSKDANKTELGFRFVYQEFYEHYYKDYITNFADIDLYKIFEVSNKVYELGVIDSSFVNEIDKSYYSLVQGIIFVFNIEIITTKKYIDEIKQFYNRAI